MLCIMLFAVDQSFLGESYQAYTYRSNVYYLLHPKSFISVLGHDRLKLNRLYYLGLIRGR